ncbi:MAG: DUF4112 domain-containing protein [Halioglobus sp.]|nr:DUF4112 domain-containing protein [Halioglobus sp.]
MNNSPARLNRLKRLARTLDSSIVLPGGYRIGLDGFIGLVPVAGDLVGAALSTYIIFESARLGASMWLLVRMMFNVLLETAVGVIPVLGDLFDFAWKANDRNVALLERADLPESSDTGSPRRRLGGAVAALLLGFIVVLIAILVLAIQVLLAVLTAL